MPTITSLRIENFKRFSGVHNFTFEEKNGYINVIAADNGVGKTSILQAFNLAIHGNINRSKKDFEEWLHSSYSIGSSEKHRKISTSITIILDSGERAIINRNYWLTDDLGVHLDLNLSVEGKPYKIESAKKEDEINYWIETVFPKNAMSRFFVDGERLSDLDIQSFTDELISGIDDVLGLGVISKLITHLKNLKSKIYRTMTSEDEIALTESILDELDQKASELAKLETEITILQDKITAQNNKQDELTSKLDKGAKEKGGNLADLRVNQAIDASKLASVRKSILAELGNMFSFELAGAPKDLENWKFSESLENMKNSRIADQIFANLEQVIPEVDPNMTNDQITSIKALTKARIDSEKSKTHDAFRFHDEETLLAVQKSLLNYQEFDSKSMLENGVSCLEEWKSSSKALSKASKSLGLQEIAQSLKELNSEIATMRGEFIIKSAKKTELETEINSLKSSLGNLSNGQGEEIMHKQVTLIEESLIPILSSYLGIKRKAVCPDLESAFAEGFSILNRKSGKLERASIDSETYSTEIFMKGFEGNWLDRELSATESQHVGLSLLYGMTRLSSMALPVVVDTPTSRMDSNHKSLSVTKFYPNLAHQVIILATSDDLSGGLYSDLKNTNKLGTEHILEEINDTDVKVNCGSLEAYFGGIA